MNSVASSNTPQLRYRRSTVRLAVALGGVLLAACTVGPNFSRPDAKLPAHWSAAGAAGARSVSGSPGTGGSERCRGYAAGAQRRHRAAGGARALVDTFQRRRARLAGGARAARQSRPAGRGCCAARRPWRSGTSTLPDSGRRSTANASYDRERISETTPQGVIIGNIGHVVIPGVGRVIIPNPYNQMQLGATASWEADLFGRVRRTVEAANASAQVSLEDQRAMQVSLLAQVAQSYLELRGAQARRAVALEDIATLADLLDLTTPAPAVGSHDRARCAQCRRTAQPDALDAAGARAADRSGNSSAQHPARRRAREPAPRARGEPA